LGWAIAAILTIWKSIIYEMNFPMIFHHLVRKWAWVQVVPPWLKTRKKLNIPQLIQCVSSGNQGCIICGSPKMPDAIRYTVFIANGQEHQDKVWGLEFGNLRQPQLYLYIIPVPYMQYLQHSPAQNEQIWYDPIINQDI
jgi:hypothetical protein